MVWTKHYRGVLVMRAAETVLNVIRLWQSASRTPHTESLKHLHPFATYQAFPGSDYYGGSVTIGLASRRQSNVPR